MSRKHSSKVSREPRSRDIPPPRSFDPYDDLVSSSRDLPPPPSYTRVTVKKTPSPSGSTSRKSRSSPSPRSSRSPYLNGDNSENSDNESLSSEFEPDSKEYRKSRTSGRSKGRSREDPASDRGRVRTSDSKIQSSRRNTRNDDDINGVHSPDDTEGTDRAQYVPISEYNALKKEFNALKKEVSRLKIFIERLQEDVLNMQEIQNSIQERQDRTDGQIQGMQESNTYMREGNACMSESGACFPPQQVALELVPVPESS